MAASTNNTTVGAGADIPSLPVRRVLLDAPWEWLAHGWRDFLAAPGLSIAYGAIFAFLAWAMTFGLSLLDLQSLILMLAGGFVLIGPLAAVGLYEVSRRLERKETVAFADVLEAAAKPKGQLGFFTVVVLVAFLIWVQLAFLLLMLFAGGMTIPAAPDFVHTLLFTTGGRTLLAVGTLVGAILAALVFSISVVSVPLLLDRDVSAATAMATSVRAVTTNPKAMLLWAALIAGFMVLGLSTLFVGLVVAFPLLGYATWHAYRALVEPAA